MKFGILNESCPGPEPWSPGREKQVITESVRQAVEAERLGWDQFWSTEHHFLGNHSTSGAPEIILTWVASQTARIRIGHAVVLASKQINHPWRIAERAATLDLLSDGRIDVGFGRGVTTDELYAFEAEPAETKAHRAEVLKMLPRMWLEDEFSWDSDHYAIPPRRLSPRPLQDPHPPLWIACGGEESWFEAAQAGVGAMSFGFGVPGRLERCIAHYDANVNQANTVSEINNQKACATFFYCGRTEQEAYAKGAQCMHMLMNVLNYYLSWEQLDKPIDGFEQYGVQYLEKVFPGITSGRPHEEIIAEQTKQGSMMVGTPDQLLEHVRAYENLGVDQLMLLLQYGHLTHDEIVESMQLFTEQVINRL
ncbi:MAG: LLM class flavin-dependent oxidoreductase [Gammaproteobacteria bacterium]|nr:LLM class flavin-dependent oxidoreductase [Gammaproteobacteria bacterium]MDE0367855.1 LLM class flavin-dependent oxidoreductase [Gammaproteobacteria bacterium]